SYLRNNASQQTISVDQVKAGGNLGIDLDGSGVRLGVWDGNIRISHREFTGRITRGDSFSGSTFSNHGTHVCGTVGASGVDNAAQGMSHGATLRAFNSSNDISEMSSEAGASNPIVASNHSYGPDYGWLWNRTASMWNWTGGSNTEAWQHGAYLAEAIAYDNLARNAPFYTIVVAAGNERTHGTTAAHQHNGSGNFTDFHATDGTNGDCLPNDATAKNVITVGNCQAIAGGYSVPGDVVLAGSSSIGPTDDGRVKPDLVAQGTGVYSSIGGSNSAYGNMGGTSMAAPAVTGSIGLLTELWTNLGGGSLRSSTIKALLIHTTDEAGGNPGPDYQFGWGLVNVESAAKVMINDAKIGCRNIYVSSINTGGSFSTSFQSNGTDPITATIAWTDPVGPQSSNNVVDESTLRLVNDLNVRVTRSGSTFFPYVLNPASPNNAATTGNNTRDNVEKIFIASPVAGATYTVTVTPNGSITGGAQAFTLILTGNSSVTNSISTSAGTVNDDRGYGTINDLTLDGTTVVNGGDLDLQSKNGAITLKENFEVRGGGEMVARINENVCAIEE
ncbi:MAG: S8 family serine peptidase, partial [Bacteroidota bacterium]